MLDLDAVFNPDAVEAEVIIAYGPGVDVDDLPGDWRVLFEERAAIKEYCGNMPRERAEAEALAEIVRLRSNRTCRRPHEQARPRSQRSGR